MPGILFIREYYAFLSEKLSIGHTLLSVRVVT